jgi:hypothetical protein
VPDAGFRRKSEPMPDPDDLSAAERYLRASPIRASFEETADLLTALQTGDAFIYYRCGTHDQHKGSVPLMEVITPFDHFKFARLECGHKIFYEGKPPGPGTMLPCVHCMEECHS